MIPRGHDDVGNVLFQFIEDTLVPLLNGSFAVSILVAIHDAQAGFVVFFPFPADFRQCDI